MKSLLCIISFVFLLFAAPGFAAPEDSIKPPVPEFPDKKSETAVKESAVDKPDTVKTREKEKVPEKEKTVDTAGDTAKAAEVRDSTDKSAEKKATQTKADSTQDTTKKATQAEADSAQDTTKKATQAEADSAQDTTKRAPPPVLSSDSGDTAKEVSSDSLEKFQKKDSTEVKALKKKSRKKSIDKTKYQIEKDQDIYTFKKKGREYRSPKKALFMSFLLPGAGQAWAKSWKRGLAFLAVDLGILGFVINYRLKGKEKMQDAYDYADAHWKRADYMNWVRWVMETPEISDSVWKYFKDDSTLVPHNQSFLEAEKKKAQGDERDYYEMIGKYEEFVRGWDDCTPTIDSMRNPGGSPTPFYDTAKNEIVTPFNTALDTSDNETKFESDIWFGESKNRVKYMGKRKEANDQYKLAVRISFLFLVNHVVAGLDAAITAKKHNDRIRNIQSFWDRIDLEVENDIREYSWYQGVKVNYNF
jgi:chemotaxis protein histidine kinase CheA